MEEKVLFDVVYSPACYQSQDGFLVVGSRYQVTGIKESPDHWGELVKLKGYPNKLFPRRDFENAREYKHARIWYPLFESDEETSKMINSPLINFATEEIYPDGTHEWLPHESSYVPIQEIKIMGFGYYVVITQNSVYFLECVL